MEKESLSIQQNVKKIDKQESGKGEKLIKREYIENTPYTAIKEGERWFAAVGNYKVTEDYNTKKELLEYIDEKDWRLITATISVIVEITINQVNNK